MHLSIILPTFNEKKNIQILISRLVKLIPSNIKKEIIVIDDNSPDGTFKILNKKFKNEKFIKLILRNSKKKRSLAASIGEGIKKSLGRLVLIMDTDLNHNPNQVMKLFKYGLKNDLVICSRFIPRGSMDDKFHFYSSYIFNWLLAKILKTGVKDNTGGFFCIQRNIINLLPFNKIFYGYGDYFFRLLYYVKFKKVIIKEIPTNYKKRKFGKSKSKFLVMIFKYLISALSLRYKSK